MPSRRDLLKVGGAFALATAASNAFASSASLPADERAADEKPSDDSFRVQRLTWAGIKIQYRDTTLFLDPLINAAIWEGAWKLPVAPLEVSTPVKFVILTHMHNDHFDPMAVKAIGKEAGVTVVCHESKATYAGSRGFRVYGTRLYEPVTVGDLTATPVPAVDGFNEYQVSWVITNGVKRVIHCGDTLWHGAFWQIGQQQGPIDVAFVPINGAKLLDKKPFSDVAGTMTPEQAVAAGVVMQAKLVVPIHYGLNDPNSYLEHPNCVVELKSFGAKRKQAVRVMESGEWMTV